MIAEVHGGVAVCPYCRREIAASVDGHGALVVQTTCTHVIYGESNQGCIRLVCEAETATTTARA